jgi:hypothetical protein
MGSEWGDPEFGQPSHVEFEESAFSAPPFLGTSKVAQEATKLFAASIQIIHRFSFFCEKTLKFV